MKKQHFLYNFRLFLFLFQYSLCVLNCFPPALLRIDWDNMVFIHPIYHFRCQQAVVETDCVLRSKYLVWEDCSSLSLIIFQYNKLLQRPSTLHSCPGAKLTPCQEDETCRECLPHTQTTFGLSVCGDIQRQTNVLRQMNLYTNKSSSHNPSVGLT